MNAEENVEQAGRRGDDRIAIWSIGIYTGPTLFDLQPVRGIKTPAVSAQDVTDIQAMFVADPFMIKVEDTWYMFFEVMDAEYTKGTIGLATSKNGLVWNYQQIVLSEPFHLSYPYVFCLNGEYYLMPESFEGNAIRLYRGDPFPSKWKLVADILEGPWVDSSIFFFDGRWWLFSNPVTPQNQVLELFYAENITGPWHRHPMSPLIQGNNRIARLGGRVIVTGGAPIRFTQDCFPHYGTTVRAFEVSQLTTSRYAERELEASPILSAGEQSWHRAGMHHIDPHFVDGKWLACVDGWRFETRDIVQGQGAAD
jgi:hypothetical protein